MSIPTPHFLLQSEAGERNDQGEWRFVLRAADGSAKFEAADTEPETRGERLELLAVVRGLEALDQPSRVTLVTKSRYVNRGIAFGLEEWRRSDWTWEYFGERAPIKNADLWQRLDRATRIHRIDRRNFRFDLPHAPPRPTTPPPAPQPESSTGRRLDRNRIHEPDAKSAPLHKRPWRRVRRAVKRVDVEAA